MKLLIVLSVIVLATARSPPLISYPDNADLINYHNTNDGLGTYRYGFEQTDGTKQEQEGVLKNAGTDHESLSVTGYFTWKGPDGVTYTVKYVADEGGYQPEIEEGPGGAVPPAVLASLLG